MGFEGGLWLKQVRAVSVHHCARGSEAAKPRHAEAGARCKRTLLEHLALEDVIHPLQPGGRDGLDVRPYHPLVQLGRLDHLSGEGGHAVRCSTVQRNGSAQAPPSPECGTRPLCLSLLLSRKGLHTPHICWAHMRWQ